MVDAGAPFVKATYTLEGDGFLVFQTYSTLQALVAAAAQHHYRNVAAQESALGETPDEVANLTAFAREGVQLTRHHTLLAEVLRRLLQCRASLQGSENGVPHVDSARTAAYRAGCGAAKDALREMSIDFATWSRYVQVRGRPVAMSSIAHRDTRDRR